MTTSEFPMGLVGTPDESLLVYTKSDKDSASYSLLLQQSRGITQDVGEFHPEINNYFAGQLCGGEKLI